VCDKRGKVRERSASVRKEEIVVAAQTALKRSSSKSVKRLAQQIGVSTCTT
jgi:hypothetical protein